MKELDLIRGYYGGRTAKRSGVPLINHIHEGLDILARLHATDATKRAYCLHPMFQADADLIKNAWLTASELSLDPWVMTLVMEYRSQANAWLSDKVWTANFNDGGPGLVQIKGLPSPGPLPQVRDMLIADKVQNYRDFCTYHQATHPRRRELIRYFEQWLAVLKPPKEVL